MKTTIVRSMLIASAALLVPMAPAAAQKIANGSYNGMSWTAQSTIVGQTSTATIAGGGSPLYQPSYPQLSGVASLIMTYGNGSQFICSGSLANDRQSIITAAHCVSDGGGVAAADLVNVKAYFYDGSSGGDVVVPFNPLSTAVDVTNIFVNPLYTGNVIDQNDIAVLRLSQVAPMFAKTYELDFSGDLTGKVFDIAGYGGRSDTGGAVGQNLGTGRLRQGENRYDFRLGDSDFGGDWSAVLGEPAAQIAYSFLSDFDNGRAANDATCAVAAEWSLGGAKYCNTGVGALEVGVAGGDSGGPQFVNGKLASVTSYGLTFGSSYGDVDNKLNSSWGEFNGFVPLYIHEQFITSHMLPAVPEPATWAMMIGGFAFAGASLRRRARVSYVAA